MRNFVLRNFMITTLIIIIVFVLKTIKADLWASLALEGLDPSLDPKQYEKVLCNIDGIRYRRVILLNCHKLDSKEEDCADWPERCTYFCGQCYENKELVGHTDSAGCYKVCGGQCECLEKLGCYYKLWWDGNYWCTTSSLFPTKPEDDIPPCPTDSYDNDQKCKFMSDKYVSMYEGVCFQKKKNKWKNDCSNSTIFLAMNLNGENVEASSGILYESEVIHSGEENKQSGKSDQKIYKVVGHKEVEISEKDRALYGTWVSPMPKGEDGQRKCLVYEVPDFGRGEEYFGLVITFLEENFQRNRTRHVTIEFGGVPISYKIENLPFKKEGRTYVHEIETIFSVEVEKSEMTLDISGYYQNPSFEAYVGPMPISICSGQCSQEGNDPTFRVAALLFQRFSKQEICRSEDPVECVMEGDCIYNTYYKTCEYDSHIFPSIVIGHSKLRRDIKHRCLSGPHFYLFVYGRPWPEWLTNTDSSCPGVFGGVSRNLNGEKVIDFVEKATYFAAPEETVRQEAELTTGLVGYDEDFMKELCKFDIIFFPYFWDEHIRQREKKIYLTAMELKRLGRDPECLTYSVIMNETGYYQLKTKLMIPFREQKNERLLDIKINGILAASTIDASQMNQGRQCVPLEVVLFFEVVDSVKEGILVLEMDGKFHSEIKDEALSFSFCNSPSYTLEKGAMINGFSFFRYTM